MHSGELERLTESGKSSVDATSSGTEGSGEKGARKRKAGLKLNQIAAKLQEKNSPEEPPYTETKDLIKEEVSVLLYLIFSVQCYLGMTDKRNQS